MKTKTYLFILSMLCVCLCAPLTVNGQVKIGDSDTPAQGAVLDLNSSYSGGLLLPNVFIENVEFIPASFTDANKMAGYDSTDGVDTNADLSGMVVYNSNDDVADGEGVYVWNGDRWEIVSGSGGAAPVVGEFGGEKTVTIPIEGGTVSGLGGSDALNTRPGSYKFALINDAGGAASLAATDPTTGKFAITFTANETGSNRTAIVRVTSPSRAYQDYELNQTGTPPVVVPDVRGTGRLTGRYCYDVAWSNNGDNYGDLASRRTRRPDFSAPQIYTFTGSGSISEISVKTEEFGDAVGKIFEGTPTVSGSGGTWTLDVKMKESLLNDAYGRVKHDALKGCIYIIYFDGSNEVYASCNVTIQDNSCCGGYVDAQGGWLETMCHNLGADQSLDPFTPALRLAGDYYHFGSKYPSFTMSTQGPLSYTRTSATWSTDWQPWAEERDPCPAGWRLPTTSEVQGLVANNPIRPLTTGDADYPTGGWNIGENLFLPITGGVPHGGDVWGGLPHTAMGLWTSEMVSYGCGSGSYMSWGFHMWDSTGAVHWQCGFHSKPIRCVAK